MSPLTVTPGFTQEATGQSDDPPTGSTNRRAAAGRITGPHEGRDSDGRLDHRYWRCERCGFESTDPRLREGCFRCRGRNRAD